MMIQIVAVYEMVVNLRRECRQRIWMHSVFEPWSVHPMMMRVVSEGHASGLSQILGKKMEEFIKNM